MKEITNIAWDVPESTYRADKAISYSTLSRFAREGFRCIPYLWDKKDAEALRFGSLVDTLITEPDMLQDKFVFAEFADITQKIRDIVNVLFSRYSEQHNSIWLIPDKELLQLLNEISYAPTWKDETRTSDIKKKGNDYYSLLYLSKDKMLMTSDDLEKANKCVDALRTNEWTSKYFVGNLFNPNQRLYFQLKFKLSLPESPRDIRCMFDIIEVDYNLKTIRPIDLKTTGKDEEEFDESFVTWRYDLQSSMYTYILRKLCETDEYFKDFTILPFTFICINRNNQTPLLWEDKKSLLSGIRITPSGQILEPWYKLLHELSWHLDENVYNYSYEAYLHQGLMELKYEIEEEYV